MASAKRLAGVLVMGACLAASGVRAQPAAEPADSPAGTWRGESLCATGAPACRNEKVVYLIEAIPGKPDAMFIRADKIVEGKAVTMGSGPWRYDRDAQTLSMESEQRVWLLHIKGSRMEGTLTVPVNVVFRRMELKKDN